MVHAGVACVGHELKTIFQSSLQALIAKWRHCISEECYAAIAHSARRLAISITQNFTAGAERHSLALKRGALRSPKRRGGNRIGYLIWHFTVDQGVAIQHMPTSEQGEHADFGGPGNLYSIGIEMCEERGSNVPATIERTAKLTAILMKKHGIPLRNVVPHYNWPRSGKRPPHKNCPHFLLDNGKPGRKWRWFQNKVNFYYQKLE